MKMMTYAEGIREGMSIRMRENPTSYCSAKTSARSAAASVSAPE